MTAVIAATAAMVVLLASHAVAQGSANFTVGSVAAPDTIKLADQTFAVASANIDGKTSGYLRMPDSLVGSTEFGLSDAEVSIDTGGTFTISIRGIVDDDVSIFTAGRTEALIVFQWRGDTDTTPDIAITFKEQGTALGDLVGLDTASFPGSLSVPDFSATIGRSSLTPDNSDHISRPGNLPGEVKAFYEEIYGTGGLPLNNIGPLEDLGSNLFATASVPTDDLGSTADDLFNFADGTTLVLEGTLGVKLQDGFNATVGGWGLQIILPQFEVPDAFPDFLELDDVTQGVALSLSHDPELGLKLAGTLDVTTDFFGGAQTFELELAITSKSSSAVLAPPPPPCPKPVPAPNIDDDGDGVINQIEVSDGTNPNDPDTDDDGRCDGQEKDDGTDPNDPDTDDDELDDGAEAALNTDPLDEDTDNDCLEDGEELGTFDTDPTDADTDDDGVSDGDEDSDGDGQSNCAERVVLNQDITVAVRAQMSGSWNQPYGVDFISVDELKIEGSIKRALGENGVVQNIYKGEVKGKATIGGKVFKVRVRGQLSGGNPEAEIRAELADTISLGEILTPMGIDLPSEADILTGSSIGPVFVQANFKDSKLQLHAAGTVTLDLYGTQLAVAGMFGLNTDNEVVVGVRPAGDLKFTDLLPAGLAAEIDDGANFTLSSADGSASFGFVYTNTTGGIQQRSVDLPPGVRDFFKPLVGRKISDKTPFDLEIPEGITALASFELPEGLAGVVDTLGAQSRVTARGNLPLGSGSAGASLDVSMQIKSSQLPEYVKSITGTIGVNVNLSTGLTTSLSGDVRWRFRAGLPEDVRDALRADSVPITVAEPVDPGAECANGLEPEPSDLSEDADPAQAVYYCFDELKTKLTGSITFKVSGEIELVATAELSTPQSGGVWNPFGIEWVGIDSVKAKVGVTVSAALDVGFLIGLQADVELFERDLLFAGQINGTLTANAPYVKIELDGFRVASGTGVEIADLIELQNSLASTWTATTGEQVGLLSPSSLQIPNIGLRNFDLSFSKDGVSDLCIAQGLVIRADLYINPSSDAPTVNPSCDSGSPIPVIEEANLCRNNFENGCAASATILVSNTGFVGILEVTDIDVGPVHIGPVIGDIALTVADQHLILEGAGRIDNPVDPNQPPLLEGELKINIRPTELDIFGSTQVFGFSSYLRVVASLGFFSGELPSLEAQVLLASDQTQFGDPAWSQLVLGQTEPVLEVIEAIGRVAGDLLDELDRTGDPIAVLAKAPAAMESAGIPVPQWLAQMNSRGTRVLALIREFGLSDVEDVFLNGTPAFTIPGIPGTYVEFEIDLGLGTITVDECLFVEEDGRCWTVPPVDVPAIDGVCDAALPASDFPGVRDASGDCRMELIVSGLFIPLFEDAIGAIIGDDDFELREIIDLVDDAVRGEPLVQFTCAEFLLNLNDQSQDVQMTIDGSLFRNPIAYQVGFDFADPEASAFGLVPTFVEQALNPGSVTCQGLDGDLFDLDVPPSTQPPINGIQAAIAFQQRTVIEGDDAVLEITFNEPLDRSRQFILRWNNQIFPNRFLSVGAGSDIAFETVSMFDDRNVVYDESTDRDTYTVSITEIEDNGPNAQLTFFDILDTTSITVINSDPVVDLGSFVIKDAVTREVLDQVDEGQAYFAEFRVDDLGSEDRYEFSVDWRDGSLIETGQSDSFAGRSTVLTTATRRYIDDDPSGTGQDTYLIAVRVWDDDTGFHDVEFPIVVNNLPPASITLAQLDDQGEPSDAVITEGQVVRFELASTDPGLADSATYTIDWGDGSPIQTVVQTSGAPVPVPHQFIDDNPTDSPIDTYDVVVTVTDDDGGSLTSDALPVTVQNVVPTVGELTVEPIDEFGEAVLSGWFSDPSPTDTYEVAIDWGDGETDTLTLAGRERTFELAHQYGDNGDYEITVVVTDDDQGVSEPGTVIVPVANVDPTLELDLSAAFESPSGPTLLGTIALPFGVTGSSTDPGSDDLTFQGTWDDGAVTDVTDFVNPPEADPFPSPSVQPRENVVQTVEHQYSTACLYDVRVDVTDDDGGVAPQANVFVVMVGNDSRSTPGGNWQAQYRQGEDAQLACYRLIAERMSAILGEVVPFSTGDEVATAMNDLGGGSVEAARSLLLREITAGWLNYASGSVGVTADAQIDPTYAALLYDAEILWADAAADARALRDMRRAVADAQR